MALDHHTVIEYVPGELESEWKLHQTPSPASASSGRPPRNVRPAVALDCEMGVSVYGEPELVRLSLVDYFSGEILIDSLVYPRVRLLHLNTRYSGVSRGMLEKARQRRQCILGGRDAARERVWRYVGQGTIVVVHGGQSDLLALRWIHGRLIDTFVIEGRRRAIELEQTEKAGMTEKSDKAEGGRSLKQLADRILGVQIQRGGRGHDSVEDAMACRWLTDWYVGRA